MTSNKKLSFETPLSIKSEHHELHSDLTTIINLGGNIGRAAQNVANILHPHFEKEEEYATPPLGLLRIITTGNLSDDIERALEMTEKLKNDLPEMIEEHKNIVNALNELIQIARANNNEYVEKFAEKLKLHANNEEEILYPAAILVGEYLQLKRLK